MQDSNSSRQPSNIYPRLDFTLQDEDNGIIGMVGTSFIVLATFGCTLNGFVIFVFCKKRKIRRRVTNRYMLALSANEFFISLLGTYPVGYLALNRTHKIDKSWCTVMGFMNFALTCSSSYFVAGIAVNRYRYLINPRRIPTYKEKKINDFLIFLAYANGLLWAFLPIVGWSSYAKEGIGVNCYVMIDHTVSKVLFISLLYFVNFLTPFFFMIIAYFKVVRVVSKAMKQILYLKEKGRNIKMIVVRSVITLTYALALAWFPRIFLTVLQIQGVDAGDMAHIGPLFISRCSSIWNPLLYPFGNVYFRKAACPFLKCKESWLPQCQIDVFHLIQYLIFRRHSDGPNEQDKSKEPKKEEKKSRRRVTEKRRQDLKNKFSSDVERMESVVTSGMVGSPVDPYTRTRKGVKIQDSKNTKSAQI